MIIFDNDGLLKFNQPMWVLDTHTPVQHVGTERIGKRLFHLIRIDTRVHHYTEGGLSDTGPYLTNETPED